MPLEEYKKKRNFKKTKEPKASAKKSGEKIFVIQRHDSSHLHYDFRLEHNGVLKSWAIPKGIPVGSEKRLAVETEDHPVEYADFEGVIPEGNYGAGTVEIFDKGKYENLGVGMENSLKKGHLKFLLRGKNVSGQFSLVKMSGKNWLLMRHIEKDDLPDVSNPDKVLFAKDGFTKLQFLQYYYKVADYILPHLEGRPVSMRRFPNGPDGNIFFQKNIPDFFPDWIDRIKVEKTTYAVCNDKKTLLYLSNLVVEFNLWLSRINKLDFPDKMIFDIDPMHNDFRQVIRCSKAIKDILDDIGLESYVMTTGSRGLHVVVPLDRKLDFTRVRSFAQVISDNVVDSEPDVFTAEQRVGKRGKKVFIDINRNSFSQTSVSPYSVRPLDGAPVAAPVEWKELVSGLDSKKYNMMNIMERLESRGDAWQGIYSNKQSLKKSVLPEKAYKGKNQS